MSARNLLQTPRPWDYAYLFTRLLLKDLHKVFPVKGSKCLDVGSGTQPYRFFYKSPGRQIVTFDLDRKACSLTVCGSAARLPFRNGAFDIVLSFATLACVPDPIQAVQEMARVLQHDGTLVLSDHQTWHTYGQSDKYHFTENAFRHFGVMSGLSLESLSTQGSFWARVGIRLNRAILPYRGGRWDRVVPLLYPIIVMNNLFFGILDFVFPMDGETVNCLAVYRKKTECS